MTKVGSRCFFQRTGQSLNQPWLVEMIKRMIRYVPVTMLARMGLATLVAPKTSDWSRARDAIKDYVAEQETHHREALGVPRAPAE